MKFYNRENELAELQRIQELSFEENSRLTVVTGRRSLIMRAFEKTPTIYLFVGRKNEASLCREFITLVSQALDIYVPEEISTFKSLFRYIMEVATRQSFNLVIDKKLT